MVILLAQITESGREKEWEKGDRRKRKGRESWGLIEPGSKLAIFWSIKSKSSPSLS